MFYKIVCSKGHYQKKTWKKMWEFLPPPLFGNDMFVRKNYGLGKPSFVKKKDFL